MRADQIKINFSSFMPPVRHFKNTKQTIIADDLIKDTIYSLNGSSRNSVNVNRCQFPVATLFAKSLRCVNRTRPKEIMITMRDFWASNLEG